MREAELRPLGGFTRAAALRVGLAAALAAGGCGGDRGDETCPPCASAPAATSSAVGSPAGEARGPVDPDATLAFRRHGAAVRTVRLGALLERIPPAIVEGYDPYYLRPKRFRALPVEAVLAEGFGDATGLAREELLLRATDGYTVSLRGSRLLEGGAFVAFEDVEVPGWEPIGPQRASPAPFYLIWSKKEQISLETHPRPWQLASIEVVRFEDAFPRTVPTGLPEGDPGWRGFAIFKEQCVHCHAMNRQGGRVGPELNVPRSVTEYRPAEQIRAFIRNPLDFRYSAMPPHPSLTDQNLDELVAYLSAMAQRKQDDPRTGAP